MGEMKYGLDGVEEERLGGDWVKERRMELRGGLGW